MKSNGRRSMKEEEVGRFCDTVRQALGIKKGVVVQTGHNEALVSVDGFAGCPPKIVKVKI